MTGKNFLLFGGVAAAVIFAISRSAGIKRSLQYLQYQFGGVRFKLDNILSPSIIVKLDLFNPNDTAIPVTDFFGNIYATDGTALARFNTPTGITIPARQQNSVEVTAKVSALNVLLKIISGQNVTKITIDGILKTAAFDLPIKKTIDVKNAISGVNTNVFQQVKMIAEQRRKKRAELVRKWMTSKRTGTFKGGFLQYFRANQVPQTALTK